MEQDPAELYLLLHLIQVIVRRPAETSLCLTWICQGAERGDSLSPTGQNHPEELIPEEDIHYQVASQLTDQPAVTQLS